MSWVHRFLLIAALSLVASCACDGGSAGDDAGFDLDAFSAGEDAPLVGELDAPGLDAPGLDAPGLDAPGLDAPGLAGDDAFGADAPAVGDDAAGPDAGRSDAGCPRSEPTRMAGVCDGRGRAICQMWSDSLGGGRMTIAACVAGGFCARADTCTASDPETCTCGGRPRCADDQVCVFSEGSSPRCECISP